MHPLVGCNYYNTCPCKVGPYLKLEAVVPQVVDSFGMVESFEMVESAAFLKFAEYVSTWLREPVCPPIGHAFDGKLQSC